MKKFIKDLAKLLNVDVETVEKFIKTDYEPEEGEKDVSELLANGIKTVSDQSARSELGRTMKAIRNHLKELGVDTSDNENVKDLLEKFPKADNNDSQKNEITEEVVKKSEWFKTLENQLKTTREEKDKEILTLKNSIRAKELGQKAKSIIEENFAISKNPKRADKDFDILTSSLLGVEEKDGEYWHNGSRIEDTNRQPLSFDEVIKKFASEIFDPKEEDDDVNGGINPKDVEKKANTNSKIKTLEELQAYIDNPNTSTEDARKASAEFAKLK